jgi:hypothetical protein
VDTFQTAAELNPLLQDVQQCLWQLGQRARTPLLAQTTSSIALTGQETHLVPSETIVTISMPAPFVETPHMVPELAKPGPDFCSVFTSINPNKTELFTINGHM